MTSTYTTNTGIEKPATGDRSGTWGTMTNTNMDLIDQALDGFISVTAAATGSTGSPNTLPITDGSVSNGRNRIIKIVDGGDLGATVYYQITPNDAERYFWIENGLSGSRSILLFQGTYNASNDIEIPAGKTKLVRSDGAGSGAVVVEVAANLAVTGSYQVDNLLLDGNSLTSTDTNGNVNIIPAGTGDVNLGADTVMIGDDDADATLTTQGTGDLTLSTNSGTNSGTIVIADAANNDITLTPNGTGDVNLVTDTVVVGDSGATATITSNGTGDLTLSTNAGTDSGTITITDAANQDITVTPNGTGNVNLVADTVVVGDSGAAATVTSNGTGDITISTNSGTNSGVITITDGTNGNIAITPDGSGEVDISKVDIAGGAIDGTTVGAASASTGAFTTLSATDDVTFNGGTFVFNEAGADKDFRIEGDSDANLIKCDASVDRVGIKTATPLAALHVTGDTFFGGNVREKVTISATAATGTVNFDAITQGVLYYTSDASGNWTLNVRGDGSTTLNSIMATGDSLTVVFLATQGSTAYYQATFKVDGSAVTPKYAGGSAPSAGNINGIDAYAMTIIKTGDAAFTALGALTGFG